MIKRGVLAVVLLLASVAGATQFVAYRLGFSPALGEPCLSVLGWRLYPPWRVAKWYRAWGASYRPVFTQAMLFPCGALAVAAGLRLHRRPAVKMVGEDCWGSVSDLKNAGLLSGRGLVIGKAGRKLLTFSGPGHALVVGGSRSGKTVGIVVPSLLTWPGSVAVFDPKGELWELTAGYRSRSSHCLRFNPTSPEVSVKWNPLLEIRRGHEIRDAQNIATVLADPAGEKNQFDIWDITASQLVTALILHVLYTADDENKHLGHVRDLLLDLDGTCVEMLTTPHRLNPQSGQPEVHPEVALVAKSLLTTADRFRSSVKATAESYLALWADERVKAVTSQSDCVIGDLVCSEHPVSLYIQVPPSDAQRTRPLTRLLLNQIARGLMEDQTHDSLGRPKKHLLLFLLEEFSSFGRLSFFEQQLRQMGSYGIKTLMVVQSFHDLMQHYGGYQSLVDNCQLTVVFASNDTATQSRVSQMTGTAVEFREGYSRPLLALGWQRQTVSLQEQVRPLLQPGDVRQLSADEQLVFVTGFKPFKTKKVKYYQEPALAKRVTPLPHPDQGLDLPCKSVENPWRGERAKGPRMPMDWSPLIQQGPDSRLGLDLDEQHGPSGGGDPEDRFAI